MNDQMEIFNVMKEHNQEQIAFYTDKSVKLRAILAIHSTALGPAMGGIRIYKYNSANEAVQELIRLSEAMTYKTAAAGLNFGGGQIIVLEQEGMERNEALFRSIGRFIESFKGRFIAGEDVGVTEECMEYIAMETGYITGLPAYYGGSGNHSDLGALGVFLGIKASACHRWGNDSVKNKKIVIQGYGRIGVRLAKMAGREKAHVFVADSDPVREDMARRDGYEIVDPAHVFIEPCDILSPCAVGPFATPDAITGFQCHIIAGSANNQLQNPSDADALKKRGILYAPDFIINSGAIIDVAEEYMGYRKEKVDRKVSQIYDRLLEIFRESEALGTSTLDAAVRYSRRRINAVTQIKGTPAAKSRIPEVKRRDGNSFII